MHRRFALVVALAAIECGLSPSMLKGAPTSPETDACAVATRDLRGQIETIKASAVTSGKRTLADRESPQIIAARDREQADALNQMLPGMGCQRLDIDYELSQPLNAAWLPAPSNNSKRHKKKR